MYVNVLRSQDLDHPSYFNPGVDQPACEVIEREEEVFTTADCFGGELPPAARRLRKLLYTLAFKPESTTRPLYLDAHLFHDAAFPDARGGGFQELEKAYRPAISIRTKRETDGGRCLARAIAGLDDLQLALLADGLLAWFFPRQFLGHMFAL
jgi:hypothetical protein